MVHEGRSGPARERAFLGASALLFLTSAVGTVCWCRSMSGGMRMPGGWTMSMAWMRMPGQTWFGAAAAFLGMWVVMMVAMMLPSLVPMLSNYRRAVRRENANGIAGRTVLAGVGYFCVWAVVGVAVYPLGIALAASEMWWASVARLAPLATGVVLVVAGCVQLTRWKARQLACCRDAPTCESPRTAGARNAWQHGLQLGVHCSLCCCGYMLILLVTDVMNLGVMALVAAAITIERIAPKPHHIARAAGVVVIAAGAFVIAHALGAV